MEKGIVVGIGKGREVEENLAELKELALTYGLEIVATFVQHTTRINPRFFIGEGKALEIKEFLEKHPECSHVLFDDTLSPAQSRNIEKLFNEGAQFLDEYKVKVMDRTELILEIFAARAQTYAGKLQVELARWTYFLPRLKKMWTHLYSQQGGKGFRGPGEKQLEMDRRKIKKRISQIKKELEKLKSIRKTQRKARKSVPLPVVSLVGYTNAGKSTLLNTLTDADVLVENKLFATLDPTVRQFFIDGNLKVLLVDTVGFIRKLPHLLVEAFHATLEEALHSDLLLHVIDGSSSDFYEKYKASLKVLEEIGADKIKRILVVNKKDLIDSTQLRILERTFKEKDIVFVSALKKEGFSELKEKIITKLADKIVDMELLLPFCAFDKYKLLQNYSHIIFQEEKEEGLYLKIKCLKRFEAYFKEFSISS